MSDVAVRRADANDRDSLFALIERFYRMDKPRIRPSAH
jgi:hypothetical protein